MNKTTEADQKLIQMPEFHGGRSVVGVRHGRGEAGDRREDIDSFHWEQDLEGEREKLFG